ncbi:phytoene desaturase family protein [Paenibacillus sp. SI8]|uniref:phytoene desaturase family protein n=1 Tax=unclassified Paenibacillus TaxID=185978 RepID=UPI0034654135
MDNVNKDYDVIIIGTGLAGLTAGALLAEAGANVLMLEQHYVVGGCASSFRRNQFLFDAAIHLVGGCEKGGELHLIYEKLGLSDKIEFMEVDPMYRVQVANDHYDIPANADLLADRMQRWFPEDRQSIRTILAEIKQIGDILLKGDFNVDSKTLMRLMEIEKMSFAQYLHGKFKHPHTSKILCSLIGYAGVPASQVSALYMMSLIMSYRGGAFYPRGSSQQMADVLKAYIISKGGEIKVKRRVESIIHNGQEAQGVIDHKGNKYYAPITISNADMMKTYREMLGEAYLPDSYQKRLRELTPSKSAVVLYGAVRDSDPHNKDFMHELFMIPDGDMNDENYFFYDPLKEKYEPWISVCCPSVAESTLAPEGYSVVTFMSMCDADHIEKIREEKGKTFLQEHYVDLLERKLPGIKNKLVLQEFATPRTIERYTLNSKGAIYGWMKSFNQPWMNDMGPETPMKGLYLAGHWTRNVHGAYGVMRSGRQTAEHILSKHAYPTVNYSIEAIQ